MRIGLMIYGSLDRLSGGYLYDRKLVEFLRGHLDKVEIISLLDRSYAHHLLHNFSGQLLHQLASLDCELLLQDELNHPSLIMLNRRLRKKSCYPIVSIVHHLRCCEDNPFWINQIYRLVERQYLSSLDGLICNSQATQKIVADLLSSSKISSNDYRSQNGHCLIASPGGDRLHPQISRPEICKRVQQEGALRLLFVGNIIPRKGLHVLLKSLKGSPSNQFIINVVGDTEKNPSYFKSVCRQIERDGLAGVVCFRGILSDDDLAGCMKASHLLVIPSFYEGFGIAYLEGMGFGLPAIGTNCGGTGEIIRHGLDGFLVSPGNYAALAEYLTRLAKNRELLLEMSLAALDRYQTQPTWENSMENIRSFLQGLID
jgi:glycosyltransferase involved in cell wall biosynthesis